MFLSFNNTIIVTDYFPDSYVTDGSVSYQKEIQKALDGAGANAAVVVFPPMIYRIDENGFKIHSNTTLSMYGAVFNLKENCVKDGYVFWGKNVANVNFQGGEIIGHNDIWPEGINIRGINISGKSRNIRIHDMNIHGLSSNGIGIFGETDSYIRDIWVNDVIIENCCNKYGDYMSARPGPEPNSKREDQGLISFYYCENFQVKGSRLQDSRSDGTHFYKCMKGQFVDNKVYGAKMGGYFIEGCKDIIASGNIIKGNGSRGTTIERGSTRCTLINNVVSQSGREGLWAPDCVGLIISGNIFEYNGRKDNGAKKEQLWNANITINEAFDPTHSPTADYLITNNIFYTDDHQHAAIFVDSDKSSDIIIKNNFFRDTNKQVLIKGNKQDGIIVENNY